MRLFSAIAGLALVVAAVLFLRYSVEHGWLGPSIRFAIGLVVGVGLLVVCELKAARRYPITANALDAAAIAILFSTFFAAHALWNLIPALATFAFLALVAALAVLLSIRRDSVFIAVLGLLGGFATPALLSTGENQPVPLFSYLLLLNVGLGWVAYRKAWPALGWLSLGLTALYQWGWVLTFLTTGQLPLATGIFLAFPAVAVALRVLFAQRRGARTEAGGASAAMGLSATSSAAMPLTFALFLAAVPAYGANAALLLGFLLVIDIGLAALAIGERRWELHAVGGVTTLVVFAVWLNTTYTSAAWPSVLAWLAAFVMLYALAGPAARAFGAAPDDAQRTSSLVAPALLFVGAALVPVEPATASPGLLFGGLFALFVFVAAVSIWQRQGWVYYLAAFCSVAAEAAWSVRYLEPGRLGAALVVYGGFGLVLVAAPIFARRVGRQFEPAAGNGIMLVASILLMLSLTRGDIAGEALWGLGLLLAILNAALFVESAAARLSWGTAAGSLASWYVLMNWWARGASRVPLLPALAVVVGLALVMLAGHVWQRRQAPLARTALDWRVMLALPVYLFLAAAAGQPALAVPPWPLFAAVAVLVLGFSATSLAISEPALHAGSVVAASVVILIWSATAGTAPWPLTAMMAAIALAAFGLGWAEASRRTGDVSTAVPAAAAISIAVGSLAALVASTMPGTPGVWPAALVQTAFVLSLLWLGTRTGWHALSLLAVVTSMMPAAIWQQQHGAVGQWWHGLVMAGAPYLALVIHPLVVGRRVVRAREPFVAAVVASAAFFLIARIAVEHGGLDRFIGLLPVVQAGLMALLLRHLLLVEPPESRDRARLALVAGAALAFITVAIPLQLEKQWITIGWALEGAALAWLFGKVPHRGLLWTSLALLAAVFVRLAANPAVFSYAPRAETPVLNWYLYTYAVSAAAFLAAGWLLARTDDAIAGGFPRASTVAFAAGGVLLFVLLNIEIADFFAEGPVLEFGFGATIAQDLTYTIGWLIFGLALLAVGIGSERRPTRLASILLITVTVLKCFLYDLSSLTGLYRVASFAGLAVSLALVSLALQKYVLSSRKGAE